MQTLNEDTPSPLKLSAMDIQWPGHLGDLVPHLDELGYHRYWATEHHGPIQSASPTLMATLAAGLSDRMRVGTAAILMKFQSPLKVAEDFRLLELFFGGRIDLGVTSAYSAEPLRSALLDGRPEPDAELYARKVEELVRLVRREGAAEGEVNGEDIGPQAETIPQVWICGMSFGSARMAARLGVAYAFHDFLYVTEGGRGDGSEIVDAYRSEFRPNAHLQAPLFNVASYGVCADSEPRARTLWKHGSDPGFQGTPEQCREQLLALRERYGTDEIVVQSFAEDFEARLESYRLLAEVLGVSSGVGQAVPADPVLA